jgi:hypothetical protein
VAHPDGRPAVKVGVLLTPRPDDLGDWLADGAAFDAAGADALWIDPAADAALDPLILTAALAAVTFRALLVTTLPSAGSSEALARTLATIGRLSQGRSRILVDALPDERVAAGPAVFVRIPADPDIPGDLDAFEHRREADPAQRWVRAAFPDSRATWRATLVDAARRGCHGLVVPPDPRLLDLLRNPDDPDDRRDLQLAQG